MSAGDTSALDLDAIHARILAAPSCDCGRPSTQWCADSECGAESCDGHARQTGALGHEHRWTRYPVATEDAVALTAEVRRLRALHDATAQAFDDLVARVWAATGETHEPPADVEALVARVVTAEVRRLRGQLAACVDALGVSVPPDATAADAIVSEWQMATGEARALRLARDAAEEEVRRLRSMLAAETASHRRDLRDDARALDDLIAEVWRALGETHEPPADVVTLLARVAAARREGAEAMRESCVSALDAMIHAEATEAELFRLTRDEDSAAEHHHKRAVLLEARVTVLGLPLPEVTP